MSESTAIKNYMTPQGYARLKAELLQELEQRQQKKGWLARLLSR